MDKLLAAVFSDEGQRETIDRCVDKGMPIAVLRGLCSKDVRMGIAAELADGTYESEVPHTAQIPKDEIDPETGKMKFRTVIIHDCVTRWLATRVNDSLFKLCSDMVHPACMSYQKGIGCGKVVQQVASLIRRHAKADDNSIIGWKADLSKYFDSVPRDVIMLELDAVETRLGKSCVVDWLRRVYNDDRLYDSELKMQVVKFQSLKQGFAPASFFADSTLRYVDDRLSQLNGIYYRYSDDTLFIGEDWKQAMEVMSQMLADLGLTLNPKKVQYITAETPFTFLGFSIRGEQISLSPKRLQTFVKEVRKRTIKRAKAARIKARHEHKPLTDKNYQNMAQQAVRSINAWMLRGNGRFSWATSCLPIINNEHDIHILDEFVKDNIRAIIGRGDMPVHVGGIGYVTNNPEGMLVRGTGTHMILAKALSPTMIDGYKSLWALKKTMGDMPQFWTLVRQTA